ncbi:MAG: 50S ribosomal protein L32 [Patescibacteria group bacterium]
MGLPSKQRTKSSKKRRASHFALKKSGLNKCSNCGKPVLPHRACPACGYYQGRQIIKFKTKKKTTKQKAQERREKAREKK